MIIGERLFKNTETKTLYKVYKDVEGPENIAIWGWAKWLPNSEGRYNRY